MRQPKYYLLCVLLSIDKEHNFFTMLCGVPAYSPQAEGRGERIP